MVAETKRKFKVGDRVICVKDKESDNYHVGKIGTLCPSLKPIFGDFQFVWGSNGAYCHVDVDEIVPLTPLSEAIYET